MMHALSKEQLFDFVPFLCQTTNMAAMVKLGYGCTNGFVAQKWLNSGEGCLLRKCRELLGLNFRRGVWLAADSLFRILLQSIRADNTFLGSESPNPKNHTQTAITQHGMSNAHK